jgi:hypothetical protein
VIERVVSWGRPAPQDPGSAHLPPEFPQPDPATTVVVDSSVTHFDGGPSGTTYTFRFRWAASSNAYQGSHDYTVNVPAHYRIALHFDFGIPDVGGSIAAVDAYYKIWPETGSEVDDGELVLLGTHLGPSFDSNWWAQWADLEVPATTTPPPRGAPRPRLQSHASGRRPSKRRVVGHRLSKLPYTAPPPPPPNFIERVFYSDTLSFHDHYSADAPIDAVWEPADHLLLPRDPRAKLRFRWYVPEEALSVDAVIKYDVWAIDSAHPITGKSYLTGTTATMLDYVGSPQQVVHAGDHGLIEVTYPTSIPDGYNAIWATIDLFGSVIGPGGSHPPVWTQASRVDR